MLGTESSLGLLNLTTQLLYSTVVATDILARLLLEYFNEVLHYSLVKVFSTYKKNSIIVNN